MRQALCLVVILGLLGACAPPVAVPAGGYASPRLAIDGNVTEIVRAIELNARAQNWHVVDVDPRIGVLHAVAARWREGPENVTENWSFYVNADAVRVWHYTETDGRRDDGARVRRFHHTPGAPYLSEEQHLQSIAAIVRLVCGGRPSYHVMPHGAIIAMRCH